jgi:hypothetical protein
VARRSEALDEGWPVMFDLRTTTEWAMRPYQAYRTHGREYSSLHWELRELPVSTISCYADAYLMLRVYSTLLTHFVAACTLLAGCSTTIAQYVGPAEDVPTVATDHMDASADVMVLTTRLTLAPPRAIDPPVLGPVLGYLGDPCVASNGSMRLVVWRDGRRNGNHSSIYATRVSASGVVLDSYGINLSASDPYYTSPPSVVWDGHYFLVMWADGRLGTRAARVAPSGEVLHVTPQMQPGDHPTSGQIHLIQDGSAVWMGYVANGSSIHGEIGLYHMEGTGMALPLSAALNGFTGDANFVWDGSRMFVAWHEQSSSSSPSPRRRVWVNRAREVTDVEHSTPNNLHFHDGEAFLYFFNNETGTSLARWRPGTESQTVLSFEPGLRFYTERGHQTNVLGACHPTGRCLLVASRNSILSDDGFGRFFALDHGVLRGDVTLAPSSVRGTPQYVATDGDGFVTTWLHQSDNHPSEIRLLPVLADGVARSDQEVRVSTAANAQTAPAASSAPDHQLLVWIDWRDVAGPRVYGRRMSLDGTPLDLGPTLLSTDIAVGHTKPVATAFNGTTHLVVWQRPPTSIDEPREVVGIRVSAEGRVLDERPFLISTHGDRWSPVSVVSARSAWFVTAGTHAEAMVSPEGVVRETHLFATESSTPVVGSDEAGFFALVVRDRSLWARRFDSGGTLLDSGDLLLHQADAAISGRDSSIEYDGRQFVIALTENGVISQTSLLRVSSDGRTVSSPTVVCRVNAGISQSCRSARVAFDGTRTVVASVVSQFENTGVVRIGTLNTRGVLETTGELPFDAGTNVDSLSLTARGGHSLLVMSSQSGGAAIGWSYRLEVRALSFDSLR